MKFGQLSALRLLHPFRYLERFVLSDSGGKLDSRVVERKKHFLMQPSTSSSQNQLVSMKLIRVPMSHYILFCPSALRASVRVFYDSGVEGI